MDEEHNQELTAPPKFRFKRNEFRYRVIKYATLTVLFLAIFFSLGFFGLETTSSSKFCSSCHEMKPEYYTWKASTHSEVDCVNCHVQPGVKNVAKDKAEGVVELYKKQTNTYTAPIQMPKDIPNSACESCHDMRKRDVTPSGDIIIPHSKHMDENIKCTKCHSGVAHGKIAERNVTFKTDYEKWDDTLGKSMMSDIKFTRTKMETCMECHEAREVSNECKTCHTTGMLPKSHKESDFKSNNHGKLAKKDLKSCNKCHAYMSETEINGFVDIPASQQFLSTTNSKSTQISAQDYAKENTFCKDCHMTKPKSHVKGFVNLHGDKAKVSTEKCLACHDKQNTGFNKTNNVTCNSCHPAMHADKNFKERHPVNIQNATRPTDFCYTCHNKPKCTSCHTE